MVTFHFTGTGILHVNMYYLSKQLSTLVSWGSRGHTHTLPYPHSVYYRRADVWQNLIGRDKDGHAWTRTWLATREIPPTNSELLVGSK